MSGELDAAFAANLGMYPGKTKYLILEAGESTKVDMDNNYFGVKITNRDGFDEIFYSVDQDDDFEAADGNEKCDVIPALIGSVYDWSMGSQNTNVTLFSATQQRIAISGLWNNPGDSQKEMLPNG